MIELNPSLSIKVLTLVVSEPELQRRLARRSEPEFRDYEACLKLNAYNIPHKSEDEILIDTSI